MVMQVIVEPVPEITSDAIMLEVCYGIHYQTLCESQERWSQFDGPVMWLDRCHLDTTTIVGWWICLAGNQTGV